MEAIPEKYTNHMTVGTIHIEMIKIKILNIYL